MALVVSWSNFIIKLGLMAFKFELVSSTIINWRVYENLGCECTKTGSTEEVAKKSHDVNVMSIATLLDPAGYDMLVLGAPFGKTRSRGMLSRFVSWLARRARLFSGAEFQRECRG